MTRYRLINPRFFLDQPRGELRFDGQRFHTAEGSWARADLTAATLRRRYFGPLLLFLLLAAGALGLMVVIIAKWLLGVPLLWPLALLLAVLLAAFGSERLQSGAYLRLEFRDGSRLRVADGRALLRQLRGYPPLGWRLALGLGVWLLATLLIYALGTRPPWRAPNELFRVCVATAAGPVLQPLATLDPTATLCTSPLAAFAGGDGHGLRLSVAGDIWLLQSYRDSLADPVEYRYRLENGRPRPRDWRHGATMARLLAALGALLPTALALALFRRVWQRREGRDASI